MGNEANCTVKFGKQKGRGKALLETSELIFRSEDAALRLKILFSAIKSAKAVEGELRLETPDGLAVFSLGANAEKWCEKILYPKSRMEKLGVKADASVSLVGDFEGDFVEELRGVTKNIDNGKAAENSQWIFLSAALAKDLAQVNKLSKKNARERGAVGGLPERSKRNYGK